MTGSPPFSQALKGRDVLVTGHTGFKGAWLAIWLHRIGARVHGFALPADDPGCLYNVAGISGLLESETLDDIRGGESIRRCVQTVRPAVVLHLAAQSLVPRSWREPRLTFETNVMGSMDLLAALACLRNPCAAVMVSSDKCYLPDPQGRPRVEEDPLGGEDPYSASKAAMEMAVWSSGRALLGDAPVRIATARAGNVIGGGDRAANRLVPDIVRALAAGRPLSIRHGDAIRPWQHVLEPLRGYLALAAELLGPGAAAFEVPWNFGPQPDRTLTVRELIRIFTAEWGAPLGVAYDMAPPGPETPVLLVDSTRARLQLGWQCAWPADEAIRRAARWDRAWHAAPETVDARMLCLSEIAEYEAASASVNEGIAIA